MQKFDMNIMISTNSKYVEPTLTMLYSLFANHQGIAMAVYMPYSNLSAEEVNKLLTFVHLFEGKELYPIEISQTFSERVVSHNGISIETYYRILAIELLPETIDKILYLDVDMVIQDSLVGLYEQNIEGYPFLVCEDILGILNDFHEMNKYRMNIPAEYSYFNAGVMLFNLKYLRENKCEEEILECIYEKFERYEYNDQDVLNELFYDKLKWIGWNQYNLPPALYYVDVEALQKNKLRFASYEEMRNASADPVTFSNRYKNVSLSMKSQAKIIHYMGLAKPWKRDVADSAIYRVFDEVYYKYNLMARNRIGDGAAEFHNAKSKIINQLLPVGYSYYYLKNRINRDSNVWLLGSSYAVQGIVDSRIDWLNNIAAPSQDLFCDRGLVDCMIKSGKKAKICIIMLGYYALYDDLSRAGELADIMRITYEPLIGTMNHYEGEQFDIPEEIQKYAPYMNYERMKECEKWIDAFFDTNDYFNSLYSRENNDPDYVGQWGL